MFALKQKTFFYYYFLFFFSLMSASPELKRARKQENGEQNGSSAAQFTILVPDAVDAKAIELLKSKSGLFSFCCLMLFFKKY